MMDAQAMASDSIDPKSLDRRMIAAVAALALTIVTSLVSIAFDVHGLAVINRILSDIAAANPARFPADMAAAGNASDHQTAAIEIAELVVLALSAGCFIVWFRRAYTNLCSRPFRCGARRSAGPGPTMVAESPSYLGRCVAATRGRPYAQPGLR